MFTKSDLDTMPHPLRRAWLLQEHIGKLRNELAGTETEYNQIVQFLKELGLKEDDHYQMSTKTTERRRVIPEKFKELFPEANETLVQQKHTVILAEAQMLLETRLLEDLTVANAKMYVGDKELNKACEVSVSEKIEFVQKP